VSADKEIRLRLAAFLDSREGRAVAGIPRDDLRDVARKFLESCYLGAGKAPELLDGTDLEEVLARALPRRFTGKEPFIGRVPDVIEALLEQTSGERFVPHAYEISSALPTGLAAFVREVSSLPAEVRSPEIVPQEPYRRPGASVSRNDPCPCGSGKKYKKCCGR
jgi:hypothetical protein